MDGKSLKETALLMSTLTALKRLYGFVGILYNDRVIFLYKTSKEGRETVENHLIHASCTSLYRHAHYLDRFFRGLYFHGRRSVRENRENLHPAKISLYTVFHTHMETFPSPCIILQVCMVSE